jgi:hypothetical protein
MKAVTLHPQHLLEIIREFFFVSGICNPPPPVGFVILTVGVMKSTSLSGVLCCAMR